MVGFSRWEAPGRFAGWREERSGYFFGSSLRFPFAGLSHPFRGGEGKCPQLIEAPSPVLVFLKPISIFVNSACVRLCQAVPSERLPVSCWEPAWRRPPPGAPYGPLKMPSQFPMESCLAPPVSRLGLLLLKQGPWYLPSVFLPGVNRVNPSLVLLLWSLAEPSRCLWSSRGRGHANAARGRDPQEPSSCHSLWTLGMQRTRDAGLALPSLAAGGSFSHTLSLPARACRAGWFCSTWPI